MATETEQTGPASSSPTPRQRGYAFRRRDLLLLFALLAVVGALAAVLIHGPAKQTALGEVVSPAHRGAYDGLTISAKPEPPLVLRNYLGNTVNVKSFRGKAVLVTFLYTHCPDICPLITSHLHTALRDMSASERKQVQIVAVSVDPRGDTPTTVAAFVHDHGMSGKMDYLIGSAVQLGTVWAAWSVGAERDAGDPALITHSALLYGITAKGRIVVVYPEDFTPSEIVHDVPRLAAA
ncbi:MAG TPA: SCO family protein [Solirubrobacteraceae bacterium]|nr:SCO family protein [Solirubrobacteraceae bacterium]